MPNISFFIPAYNCAATVAESVESIMATNFAEGDELAVTNDCSSDNTAEVLLALQAKYPVIKIVTHSRNKGGAAARNTAVENTTLPLLFCLDADNVLADNSVRPLINFLAQQQADIACFEQLHYFVSTKDVVDEIWSFKPGVFTITDLLHGGAAPGASGNYLFTRQSWLKAKGYTEDLGALDTWSFGFKQLMEQCKMVVMANSFYYHRRGHDSYYLRDAWNKRKSVSLRLIKLIISYIDQIHPDDVDYIFSKKGRYSWLDNLEKRPIRLVNKTEAQKVWTEHELKNSFGKKMLHRSRHYKNRLIQILTSKNRA
ncbi:MAG: glycosyltransferase family 2 protein [Bacteroidota bacterium]